MAKKRSKAKKTAKKATRASKAKPKAVKLSKKESDTLKEIGFHNLKSTSGTTLLTDDSTRICASNNKGIELLPMREALKRYPEVQDLCFKLIDPHLNEHTELVFDQIKAPIGHFIRVKEGHKVKLPVQAFNLIETPMTRQFIHNIVVLEKNAELEIIGGSTVTNNVRNGLHVCVSETYLHENAKLTSTSIEHWGKDVEVFSYGACLLEKGARSTGKEIIMTEVKRHHSESKSYLHENAVSQSSSVIFAPPGSKFTGSSEEHLKGKGASTECVQRTVTAGGIVNLKTEIIGETPGGRGFTSCNGLLLNEKGSIETTPALKAVTTGLELSHESSVGRIEPEHLHYLMASGLTEEQAQDLIITGFLNLNDTALPKHVKSAVKKIISQAKSGGM